MSTKAKQKTNNNDDSSDGSNDDNNASVAVVVDWSTARSAFAQDLTSLAKDHVTFLQRLHTKGISIQRPTKESLRRYRDLWLPLVHYHSPSGYKPVALIPPPDIAWLWHCHRLAPFRYSKYIQRRFASGTGTTTMILEATPPFAVQFHDDGDEQEERVQLEEEKDHYQDDTMVVTIKMQTRSLWKERYPQEPFFLSSTIDTTTTSTTGLTGTTITTEQAPSVLLQQEPSPPDLWLDGFDLLASTSRQATFLWQVSGPRFQDDTFLQQGLINYYKFLRLKKKENPQASAAGSDPNQIIVPTYQIDLLWHTHILANLSLYYSECRQITGKPLHHDDSFNDRSEGGTLDRAFRETQTLWKERYREVYHIEGGMYRGEPPPWYYRQDWNPSQDYDYHHHLHPYHHDHQLYREQQESPQFRLGGPFVQMINVQGATSTNPVLAASTAPAPTDQEVQWCWKETSHRVSSHPPSSIVGDPSDGWIAYDPLANARLESAFLEQGSSGQCTPLDGYLVDFATMKQKKVATGFKRRVQRVVQYSSGGGVVDTNAIAVLIDNQDTPAVANVTTNNDNFIWCWKESNGQMQQHPPNTIVGDPSDRWIRYDDAANAILETAYQSQAAQGKATPLTGYEVDFRTMKQKKLFTGFLREVCRIRDPGRHTGMTNVVDNAASPRVAAAWTDVNGTAPDGQPGFIEGARKSIVKGVNNNKQKIHYIFGKEKRGMGYYHETTREAYKILYHRVRKKILRQEADLTCDQTCNDCNTILNCGLGNKFQWVDQQEDKLKDLRLELEIIAARANAAVPFGMVGIPSEQIRDPQTTRKYYSDDGVWFFPPTFYALGGGCGGSYNTTGLGGDGGVLGGACGAAGCGAGACGAMRHHYG